MLRLRTLSTTFLRTTSNQSNTTKNQFFHSTTPTSTKTSTNIQKTEPSHLLHQIFQKEPIPNKPTTIPNKQRLGIGKKINKINVRDVPKSEVKQTGPLKTSKTSKTYTEQESRRWDKRVAKMDAKIKQANALEATALENGTQKNRLNAAKQTRINVAGNNAAAKPLRDINETISTKIKSNSRRQQQRFLQKETTTNTLNAEQTRINVDVAEHRASTQPLRDINETISTKTKFNKLIRKAKGPAFERWVAKMDAKIKQANALEATALENETQKNTLNAKQTRINVAGNNAAAKPLGDINEIISTKTNSKMFGSWRYTNKLSLSSGNWSCTACETHNFARNKTCIYCDQPNLNPLKVPKPINTTEARMSALRFSEGTLQVPLPTPSTINNNNNNNNTNQLAATQTTHTTQTIQTTQTTNIPKPSPLLHQLFDKERIQTKERIQIRPGDWNCTTCQTHNFARNNSCVYCDQTITAEGIIPWKTTSTIKTNNNAISLPNNSTTNTTSTEPRRLLNRPYKAHTEIQIRPGDWHCATCQTHNFARNNTCVYCNQSLSKEEIMHNTNMKNNIPKTASSNKNLKFLEELYFSKGMHAAKKHFYKGVKNNKVDTMHCDWAIKNVCDTAAEAQNLIETMQHRSISIETNTLNHLMTRFLMEGKTKEAQHVLEIGFEKERLIITSETRQIMSNANELASIGLDKEMKHIFKEKGQGAAMRCLQQSIEKAELRNYVWAMRSLCNTSNEIMDLIIQMEKKNVKMEEFVLNILIYQLLLEDKIDQAEIVLEKEFDKHGLEPNTLTYEYMNDNDRLAEIGYSIEMERLLHQKGKEASVHLLKTLIANGRANATHCGWGIKELCDTSNEVRDLLVEIKAHNISINEAALNTLINKLLVENKKEEAQVVMDVDFHKYGLNPNVKTHETMDKADKLASIGRTIELERLFEKEGKASSMKYLTSLILNGDANKEICGWSMKMICDTALEISNLIALMDANNISVSEKNLNVYIHQLVSENKREEAQRVLDVDFDKYGVHPNENTYETMDSADKLAGIGHTTEMARLLKMDESGTDESDGRDGTDGTDGSKGKDKSMKYLKNLIMNQEANTMHCAWGMRELCDTSNEAYGIQNLMENNNIPVNEFILNILIHKLLLEDKRYEAQIVIDVDFVKHGMTPNERTRNTMKKADNLANMGHMTELKRLLKETGTESTLIYLYELITNGQAKATHCGWGMKTLCVTSMEVRELIQHMNRSEVAIEGFLLNMLIDKLLMENKRKEAQIVIDMDFETYGLKADNRTFDKMKMKQKKDFDDDEDDGDVIYFKPGTGGLRHHMDDVDGNDPHDVHTTYF